MSFEQSQEINRLRKLSAVAQIGWWEADFNTREYVCSEYLCKLLGLTNSNIITFTEFFNLIHEEYRERIIHGFASIQNTDIYEFVFPINSVQGIIWVRSRSEDKWQSEDGHLKSFGTMQMINMSDDLRSQDTIQKLNKIQLRQHSISHTLYYLLHNDNLSETIPNILKEILDFFNEGHIYIMEFNQKKTLHTCTYQVTENEAVFSTNEIDSIGSSEIPWWTEQLTSGKPIIIDSVTNITKEHEDEYRIFTRNKVKSAIAIPLKNSEDVWGYLGVNLMSYHRWNNEDYQWLLSLANIIAISISLWRTKKDTKKKNTFLTNLFRHMPLGYAQWSVYFDGQGNPYDYKITNANELRASLCGQPSENYIGKLASEIYSKKELQQKLELIAKAQATNTYIETDEYFEETDKNCYCVVYSPEPKEFVCLYLDTTNIVKTSSALDHGEKVLQNIFANIPVGVEIYDENGTLTRINAEAMRLFGVKDQNEVLGLNFFDNPNLDDEIRKQIIKNDEYHFHFNYQFDLAKKNYYNTPKSGFIPLFIKINKMYNSQGKYLGFVLIDIDYTERLESLKRIHDFENFFSIISDHAKVGYAKVNKINGDGYAIKQWYKNLGEDPSTPMHDIVGNYSKFYPKDREKILDFFENAKQGLAKTFKGDARILKPGTQDQWNWIRIYAVLNECDPLTGALDLIGVNYDITELKETEIKLIQAKEKAETADRLKSAFLANMSHEIRTPLNAIVGFSNLLVEAETDEEKHLYMSLVEENNNLLLQLISDILDLAKIEAGIFEFNYTQIDLNKLCQDLAASIRLRAAQGVEVVFEPTLPECLLVCDSNRIHQVIANFLTNAVKFTQKGSITVGYEKLNDTHLRIYVTDTGMGIDKEQCTKIFERFIKLNNFIQGTGLGLSICRSIIEQMEGTIGVDSVLGKGSTFWFIIPINTKLTSI